MKEITKKIWWIFIKIDRNYSRKLVFTVCYGKKLSNGLNFILYRSMFIVFKKTYKTKKTELCLYLKESTLTTKLAQYKIDWCLTPGLF